MTEHMSNGIRSLGKTQRDKHWKNRKTKEDEKKKRLVLFNNRFSLVDLALMM